MPYSPIPRSLKFQSPKPYNPEALTKNICPLVYLTYLNLLYDTTCLKVDPRFFLCHACMFTQSMQKDAFADAEQSKKAIAIYGVSQFDNQSFQEQKPVATNM